MKKWTPSVGDFVVAYGLGKGIIVSIGHFHNASKEYLVQLPTGRQEWVKPIELRKATFWEVCRWPTGFGRTKWALFYATVAVVGYGVVCFATDTILGWGLAWVAAMAGVYVLGTWMNYTRRWV